MQLGNRLEEQIRLVSLICLLLGVALCAVAAGAIKG